MLVNYETLARLGSVQYNQGEAWNVYEERHCVSFYMFENSNPFSLGLKTRGGGSKWVELVSKWVSLGVDWAGF